MWCWAWGYNIFMVYGQITFKCFIWSLAGGTFGNSKHIIYNILSKIAIRVEQISAQKRNCFWQNVDFDTNFNHFWRFQEQISFPNCDFWYPGGHLGHLPEPLGQSYRPTSENKENRLRPRPALASKWGPFGIHFSNQYGSYSLKDAFQDQYHNQDQFLFDFGDISVTPGPWKLSSRPHGGAIFKKWLR